MRQVLSEMILVSFDPDAENKRKLMVCGSTVRRRTWKLTKLIVPLAANVEGAAEEPFVEGSKCHNRFNS